MHIKYEKFAPFLNAACNNIECCYYKTTELPAYIMSMSMQVTYQSEEHCNSLLALNPGEKMSFFRRHWPPGLQKDVLLCAEEVVRAMFQSLPLMN